MDRPPSSHSRQYIAAGGSVGALDELQRLTEQTVLAVLAERTASGYVDISEDERARLARACAQRLRSVQATALLAELQRYVGQRAIDSNGQVK